MSPDLDLPLINPFPRRESGKREDGKRDNTVCLIWQPGAVRSLGEVGSTL